MEPINTVPYKLVFVSVDGKYNVSDITDEFDEITLDSVEKDERIMFVMNEIKYNKLCDGINKEYVTDALSSSSFFIYLHKKTAPRTMEGIVIVKDRDDSLYIDIICGSSKYSGIGSIFIEKIITLARKAHKTKVTLSSLTQSLGFYLKKGFVCNDTCDMKFVIEGGGNRRRSYKNVKRKNRKYTHKRRK